MVLRVLLTWVVILADIVLTAQLCSHHGMPSVLHVIYTEHR